MQIKSIKELKDGINDYVIYYYISSEAPYNNNYQAFLIGKVYNGYRHIDINVYSNDLHRYKFVQWLNTEYGIKATQLSYDQSCKFITDEDFNKLLTTLRIQGIEITL